MKRLFKILFPDANPNADSRWCKLGLHYWDSYTGMCRDCKFIDRILRPDDYRRFRETQEKNETSRKETTDHF
ncbi:hypothetical protein LCGC14_1578180 [marine sediment metagenome]|uniref:Uncharacterized protein n=1 Tax=marine sediment metagenome TaxID=412755 RepID=A0A0F9KYL0_9ZZZZ